MTMKDIKIGLITDALTETCLSMEANTVVITPLNYRWKLHFQKPDFLFIESAWHGSRRSWKNKIASSRKGNNKTLAAVVDFARKRNIPTVFWNKEDGVHFDRFIDSASLCDYIFTVDETCIPRYKAALGEDRPVQTLTFPVQHKLHKFEGFQFQSNSANFTGSYSRHIHDRRREWQDLLFGACHEAGVPLTIYDRNSGRRDLRYRYPEGLGLQVRPAVKHTQTVQIYRHHLISLNVNTIENSPSMYSRRLVEILACGGIAVTNPSPAVDRYFVDYCHVIQNSEEAVELFCRLRSGPSKSDLNMAKAGSEYVHSHHTWTQRLEAIRREIGV
jgi:hypothetical protein